MKQYVHQHGFQLAIAAVLVMALATGLIDPATATIGGMATMAGGIMLDTSPSDIKELHAATQEALKRIGEQVKEVGQDALAQAKQAGDLSAETKTKVDELLVKQGELQAQIQDAHQKLARRGSDAEAKAKSVGAQLVEAEDFKAFAKAGMRSSNAAYTFPFHFNAATMVTEDMGTTNTTTVGVPPDMQPGVIQGTERQLRVRDLITPGRTTSNMITYVRETGFTNNAAPVSEGNRKPESALTYEQKTAPVITIAHFIKASKQILDDFMQLQSMINGRLMYGLKLVEENQLLKGSGTGNNLNGIYTQATAYSAPSGAVVTSETRIDRLRLMLLQAALAEYPPTGIVLHPTDWANIELTKDDNKNYIFANPRQLSGPSLWGLPVVPTQAMTVDTGLVGAFRLGAQIFDREDANIVIATQNEDDFVNNLITIRCEERLALAVYRPEAFIKATDLSP